MATNPILNMVAGQGLRVKNASDLLVGTTIQTQNKMDEVLTGMSQALESQAANSAIVLQTRLLAQQEAERKASALMSAGGGIENLMLKVNQVNAAGEKLSGSVAEMSELRETSFFGDGPLAWIGAQIKLPKSEQRVKDNVLATQAARSAAIDLNNVIQESVKTTQATTRTVTDLSINAATDALKAEYDFKSGQVQLDRLRNSLIGVEAIARAEEGALQRAYSSANLIRGEEQWKLTLDQFKRQRENDSWAREDRLAARQTRLEQQQFDDSTRAKINLARNSRGEPPLEGGEWRSFKEFTPKDQIGELVRLGEQAAATGIPFIANSPADSAKVFLQNPNIKFEDTRQKSAELIFQALNDLGVIKGSTDPKTQAKYDALIKDKSGQQAESFINSRVQEIISGYTANTDAPTNPFNLGDLGAFLGNGTDGGVSTMTSLPVSQKVLLPAIRAGIKLDSPAAVTRLLGDAVRTKQITSSEAANGISALYLRANALHRSSMGLRALGVVMPAGSEGYRTTVNGQTVDMTDQVQVSRVLTNQIFGINPLGQILTNPLNLGIAAANKVRELAEDRNKRLADFNLANPPR